jgi:hypothetical protein
VAQRATTADCRSRSGVTESPIFGLRPCPRPASRRRPSAGGARDRRVSAEGLPAGGARARSVSAEGAQARSVQRKGKRAARKDRNAGQPKALKRGARRESVERKRNQRRRWRLIGRVTSGYPEPMASMAAHRPSYFRISGTNGVDGGSSAELLPDIRNQWRRWRLIGRVTSGYPPSRRRPAVEDARQPKAPKPEGCQPKASQPEAPEREACQPKALKRVACRERESAQRAETGTHEAHQPKALQARSV